MLERQRRVICKHTLHTLTLTHTHTLHMADLQVITIHLAALAFKASGSARVTRALLKQPTPPPPSPLPPTPPFPPLFWSGDRGGGGGGDDDAVKRCFTTTVTSLSSVCFRLKSARLKGPQI